MYAININIISSSSTVKLLLSIYTTQ